MCHVFAPDYFSSFSYLIGRSAFLPKLTSVVVYPSSVHQVTLDSRYYFFQQAPRHQYPPQPIHPHSFRLLPHLILPSLHDSAFSCFKHPQAQHRKKDLEWMSEEAEATLQFGDGSFSHGNCSRFECALESRARLAPWVAPLVGVVVSFWAPYTYSALSIDEYGLFLFFLRALGGFRFPSPH